MFRKLRPETGFTLLEVMIALAILGIGLGISMQLFSGGLKSVQKSEQYTNAVFLARHKLEESLLETPLEEGFQRGFFSGDFTDFAWEVEVAPYAYAENEVKANIGADDQMLIKMFQVKVKVSWEEGEKEHKIELETLRTYLDKEALFEL